jgi:hypothetical protein
MKLPHRLLALACISAALLASSDASAVKNPLLLNLMKRLHGTTNAGNLHGSAIILNIVKAMGPDEYAGWGTAAEKARVAANKGDAAALKTACNGCHDQYRESYRNKYGSKGPPNDKDGKGPVPIPVPIDR